MSKFIVSLISIPLCGRYLERVWSYNELLKFAFVTILASNIISVGFSWIVYFLLNDVKSMYVLPSPRCPLQWFRQKADSA